MHLAQATSSNVTWQLINRFLQPAALMYLDVCAWICIGNTGFNFHDSPAQLFLLLIISRFLRRFPAGHSIFYLLAAQGALACEM